MILASTSPRRKELLEKIGFKLTLKSKKINEESDKINIVDKVKDIAYKKTIAVAQENKNDYVVGADTVVVIGEKLLGKPKDIEEAKEMLKLLSNKEHEVITSYCLINLEKNIEITEVVISKVVFRKISDDELNWYIKNEEILDKAGAYGVQGLASIFIEKIEGDYFAIMGFPINSFIQTLRQIGIDIDNIKNI